MLLARLARLTLLTFAAASAAAQTKEMAATVSDAPPASCHATLPSDGRFIPPSPVGADPRTNMGGLGEHQFWFGSSKLWTMLPIDGIWRPWRSSSGRPGDFAYDNKLPWFRMPPGFSTEDGPLTVTGRKRDGPAPAFTETYEGGGRSHIMIMGGISIPVSGCWNVTGHYEDQELSFTVWVPPIAEQKQNQSAVTHEQGVSPERSAQMATHRIYLDARTQAKRLVYKVTPEIPPGVDVAGTVLLHAIIGPDGRAHDLQYVSGPQELARAATNAVIWWQYRVDDEAAEVDTTIEVAFSPHNE